MAAQVVEIRMDQLPPPQQQQEVGQGQLQHLQQQRNEGGQGAVASAASASAAQNAVVLNAVDEKNKWIADAVSRDRDVKERKMLAQRWLVRFQNEETTIFEANLTEARQLYETQLNEQRQVDWRQRLAAEELVEDEGRKSELVKLVTKMAALKARITVQDEARDREVAFREKVKLRRDAHQVRVKSIEERQKKEREELVATQQRIAKNAEAVQSIQVRGMDEPRKRKALREFAIQSQQLAMRQQKEAEQLREMQLLKIRHLSEMVQLELGNMTEMEELTAEQRQREAELEAEHAGIVLSEQDKLERQQAKLKALQLKEEQKIQRNVLKQAQRRQSKLLDRQQRLGGKLRERSMMAQNLAILGGEAGSDDGASEMDTSDAGDSSFAATSTRVSSDAGDAVSEHEMDAVSRATTDGNATTADADGELRRKRTATSDAERELHEALQKGQDRVRQLEAHQRKMVDELRKYHREVRDQKAREHKRKTSELTKDHEDELRSVKTEQATEMDELLETIGHQDLITAQQSSFDKQMDTMVSNQLLGNMLPRHVAEELKAGRTPEPASFDNVALFFTDIYGFKELANRSSPRQIVALLNRMYIAFDQVIADFPTLYKVETVMDSFMVCSGLSDGVMSKTDADRINDATVATTAALRLLAAVRHIDMSDQLVDRVDLRIGIQCGPVLAGVIGTKMPHYCLFGDTVNVASRMCSTNLPLKVQVSETMANWLDKSTFDVVERGTISVKGKGEMKTFWVSEKQ